MRHSAYWRTAWAVLALVTGFSALTAQAARRDHSFDGANWIWYPVETRDRCCLRAVFELKNPSQVAESGILAAADDGATFWLNGRQIGQVEGWRKPVWLNVETDWLAPGPNLLAVEALNQAGDAGLLCELLIQDRDGTVLRVVSDARWRSNTQAADGWKRADFNDLLWPGARNLGRYPCSPWGRLLDLTWEEQAAILAAYRHRWRQSNAKQEPAPSLEAEPESEPRSVRLRIDPQTHLLTDGAGSFQLFFTIYDQMGPGNRWRLSVLDFDYDLLERDFAVMRECGVHIYLRKLAWNELLDEDGDWKRSERQPVGENLPDFEYNYEIYDHFFERARAHGLQVVAEADVYWGMLDGVISRESYGKKVVLYDELWDVVVDAYERIVRRMARHTNLCALLLGEEGAPFDLCLEDKRTRTLFGAWLLRRYSTIPYLRSVWGELYDTSDRSGWTERDVDGRRLLFPQFDKSDRPWEIIRSFEQAPLPRWEYLRDPAQPDVLLREDAYRTYGLDVVEDPVAVDFFRWRQELVHERLQQWSNAMREAAPDLLLHFSGDADFCLPWHFPQYFDRAKLPFDVIGVGQHDHGTDVDELPHWASVREVVQNHASYVPYLLTAPAQGIAVRPSAYASGEGGGSTRENREGTHQYFPAWMIDLYGNGAAYVLSYTWCHLSGRSHAQRDDYSAPMLDWLRENMPRLTTHPITLREDADVLILRNLSTVFSFQGGYDYGNVRALAGVLAQTHVPFHVVVDADISVGPIPGRVDLSRYRVIYVPVLAQQFEDRTWEMLRLWLADPRHGGERALVLGLISDRGPYFQHLDSDSAPSALQEFFGGRFDYEARQIVRGEQIFTAQAQLSQLHEGTRVSVTFPQRVIPEQPNLAIFSKETIDAGRFDTLLTDADGNAVAIRRWISGNSVYLIGFPLGLACDALWGSEQDQEPHDALTDLIETPLVELGIHPTLPLPRNVVGYLSDDGELLMVKERFGVKTDTTVRLGSPRRDTRLELAPYETKLIDTTN